MATQEQQNQVETRNDEARILTGIRVFFYLGQETFMRYGKKKTVEKVLADVNMDLGFNTTVPVTVYPRKFLPVLWSPDQPVSERKFYTVDVRVLEGRRGYYGYAEPSKGTLLLDSEQIAIKRVEGMATEKLAFKLRGQWWDGSPKFVAYSREYINRPVVLEQGLTVNEGETVTVVLTENPRARRGDLSLVAKLMLSAKQPQAQFDSPTVDLLTPTVLKKNVTEAKSTTDFQHSTNKVSIYDVLSSKKMGIAVTADSRAWEIRKASEMLTKASDPTLVKERFPNLPLIMEAQLGGLYDAIEAAADIALKIAIQKFGDEPEPTEDDRQPRHGRRRNRNRNRTERNTTEQNSAESATGQTEADTTVATESQVTTTAVEYSNDERDTVRPGAPPTFEEEVEVEVELPVAEAPKHEIDATIVAKAKTMRDVTPEVLERAFMNEVERMGKTNRAITLEEFLTRDERFLAFRCREAKAELLASK